MKSNTNIWLLPPNFVPSVVGAHRHWIFLLGNATLCRAPAYEILVHSIGWADRHHTAGKSERR